jgi:hypothetical protein
MRARGAIAVGLAVAMLAAGTAAAATPVMTFAVARRALTNHARQLTASTGERAISVTNCIRRSAHGITCLLTIVSPPLSSSGAYEVCSAWTEALYVGNSHKPRVLNNTKWGCIKKR